MLPHRLFSKKLERAVYEMLVKEFKTKISFPECLPTSQRLTVELDLSGDIRAVLPYLNAVLEDTDYDHKNMILQFRKEKKRVILYPKKIYVATFEDRAEAQEFIRQLIDLINDTYRNRKHIQPKFTKRRRLHVLEIFKYLPGTNCGECGLPTCLAFAAKLVSSPEDFSKCSPLLTEEFKEGYDGLKKLLDNLE
nr:Fe-S cluster protein [Desulfobacterales bacterium]